MNQTLRSLALALALALPNLPVSAAALTRWVPGEYSTVAAALSVSVGGDSVVVAPGIYAPSTNGETFPLILPPGVVLVGAGLDQSILDAEDSGGVLRFESGSAVVRGFRITGGNADRGGGAQILGGSPEISRCLFLRNRALRRGSGINVQGTAAPWIHHNVVWESFDAQLSHPGDPHGIQLGESATGVVEHNLIGRGDSNGLLVGESAAVVIRHNIFFENGIDGVRGRGICNLGDPSTVVSYNLFYGNSIAAMVIRDPAGGFADLSGAAASDFDATDSIYANFDGDPRLVSPGLLLFQLQGDSPAIDAGDPTLPGDPDGSIADLGPYYYPRMVSASPVSRAALSLAPNVPNPFNPRTELRFEVREAGEITLDILDARGRRVRRVVRAHFEAGENRLQWDGRDGRGRAVPSGAYAVRLWSRAGVATRWITLVR